MAAVTLDKASFELAPGESVLDCLLRHGQAIPHSCKSGVCQACLVKAVDGVPDAKASKGLKPTLQASGYALACQWQPDADVGVRLPGLAEDAVEVRIAALDRLNPDVMRLLIASTVPTRFSCRPGQYLNLINPQGVARSYSIANDPALDGHIELHVAATTHGEFTRWLFTDAQVGQTLHIRGPAGDCFYLAESACDFPMLLVGTGTGLAPLYGIARDALRQGHQGPIRLLHGGSAPERLYYVKELRELASAHANFAYQPLALKTAADSGIPEGNIEDHALQSLDHSALASTRVFLCGAPEFVQGLRKKLFLKGLRSAHIFCDAFVSRKAAA